MMRKEETEMVPRDGTDEVPGDIDKGYWPVVAVRERNRCKYSARR